MQRFNHRVPTPTRQGIRSGVHRFQNKPPSSPCPGLVVAPGGPGFSVNFVATATMATLIVVGVWENTGAQGLVITCGDRTITIRAGNLGGSSTRGLVSIADASALTVGATYTFKVAWVNPAKAGYAQIIASSAPIVASVQTVQQLSPGVSGAAARIGDGQRLFLTCAITSPTAGEPRPNLPVTATSVCTFTDSDPGVGFGMSSCPKSPDASDTYGWRWNTTSARPTRIQAAVSFATAANATRITTGTLA